MVSTDRLLLPPQRLSRSWPASLWRRILGIPFESGWGSTQVSEAPLSVSRAVNGAGITVDLAEPPVGAERAVVYIRPIDLATVAYAADLPNHGGPVAIQIDELQTLDIATSLVLYLDADGEVLDAQGGQFGEE